MDNKLVAVFLIYCLITEVVVHAQLRYKKLPVDNEIMAYGNYDKNDMEQNRNPRALPLAPIAAIASNVIISAALTAGKTLYDKLFIIYDLSSLHYMLFNRSLAKHIGGYFEHQLCRKRLFVYAVQVKKMTNKILALFLVLCFINEAIVNAQYRYDALPMNNQYEPLYEQDSDFAIEESKRVVYDLK
ncbi:hypothetical protein GJ496_008446 [Pomphorhynchus laevis]|nr:hypothetical protein GJ496_008446 [Pomphorhynchus laevis]